MDEQTPSTALNMPFWQSENQQNSFKGSKENEWMSAFDDMSKGLVKIKKEIMEPEEGQIDEVATNDTLEGTTDSAAYKTAAQIKEESVLIKGTELAFKEGLLSENEKIVFRNVLERVLILGKDDHSSKSTITETSAPQLPYIQMAESGTSGTYSMQDDRYFKMVKDRDCAPRSNAKTMAEDEILGKYSVFH